MMRPVILIGAGGHARVLFDTLRLAKRDVKGCLAKAPPPSHWPTHCPYLGDDDVLQRFDASEIELVLGVGSTRGGAVRRDVFTRFRQAGYTCASVVHPTAWISQDSRILASAQVMAGSIIQSGAVIGENVIVNSSAVVEHGCRIDAHAHVATGAILCGDVVVGEMAHVGAGVVVLQGLEIGVGATVGAGAVVTNSVPAGVTVAGNPARKLGV